MSDCERIRNYEEKIEKCTTMTDLLVVMASWQSFAQSHALTQEEKKLVDEAYLKAEERLLLTVKTSPW